MEDRGRMTGRPWVLHRVMDESGGAIELIDCGVCCYNIEMTCRLDGPQMLVMPQERQVLDPQSVVRTVTKFVPMSIFPPVRRGLIGCREGIARLDAMKIVERWREEDEEKEKEKEKEKREQMERELVPFPSPPAAN